MATPGNQSNGFDPFLDEMDFLDDLDEDVKLDINTTTEQDLTLLLRQAAKQLPEELSKDPEKKAEFLMATIAVLQAHSELEVVAHQLFPEGVKITYPGEEDEILEPTSAGKDDRRTTTRSGCARETSILHFDPGYVPESLRDQASTKTTKVYETLLWLRQGEVGKIKSIVIKPKGYAKPFQLFCAQLSRSVTRWADGELAPPDGTQTQAQVMTRFDEKAACFARIVCFNEDLELTTSDRFDVTVDTRAEAFIVEARTYERDFVGVLPKDEETGKPVELALGVATTWYSIPLVKNSPDKLIARCVIDAGRELDTIPIQVDSKDVRKLKMRTYLRQPQNHDWLLSWVPDGEKGKRHARRGDGEGAGGHDGYPGDSGDDSDPGDHGNRGLSRRGRVRVGAGDSRVRSTLGSIRQGDLYRY